MEKIQTAYYNGKFLPLSSCAINPFDRGFLLGDGLFETIRCYQGVPFRLKEHWDRLTSGAKDLFIPVNKSFANTKEVIDKLLAENHLKTSDAGIRLTLTRGMSARGIDISRKINPTWLITSFIINNPPQPISLMVSSRVRNERSSLSRYKTLCYLENVLAREEAKQQGFDDALLINTQDNIVSSTVANIFFITNSVLMTPKIEDGALPGIMRKTVLEVAAELNIRVKEKNLSVACLENTQEAFLTNSLIEILPIKSINSQLFPLYPGPITQKLMRKLAEKTQKNKL